MDQGEEGIHMKYMSLATLLVGCISLQGYLVRVENNTPNNVWVAVYEQHQVQQDLTRRSKPRFIGAGEAAWVGGVRENSDTSHYLLYGSSQREALLEHHTTFSAIEHNVGFLCNVGTGERLFMLQATETSEPLTEPLTEALELAVLNALETVGTVIPSKNETVVAETATAPSDEVIVAPAPVVTQSAQTAQEATQLLVNEERPCLPEETTSPCEIIAQEQTVAATHIE